MLIPEINPDEFGAGYMIRLGITNDFTSFKQLNKALLSRHGEPLEEEYVAGVHVAKALNMDVAEYCQRHTLLPIYRSITNTDPEIVHGNMKFPHIVKRLGYFGFVPAFQVCEECIKEDLNYLGYSYYRRSHQLPGVMTCSKHHEFGAGVLKNPGDRLFVNPDALQLNQAEGCGLVNNEVYKRYAIIVDGVSSMRRPIPASLVVSMLQEKASEMDIRWLVGVKGDLYSDYVVNNVPEKLLESLSVSTRTKSKGKKHPRIDSVLEWVGNYIPSLAYILAYAILYKDADEALSDLYSVYEKISKQRNVGFPEKICM